MEAGGQMLTTALVDSHLDQLSFSEDMVFIQPADTTPVRHICRGDSYVLVGVTSCRRAALLSLRGLASLVRQGEKRQSVRTALTQSTAVHAALCFPHLPKGTEYSFHFVTTNNYLSNSL